MEKHLIGVRHDGGGKYARQTSYTDDPGALARAEAVDPGHAHGIFEYSVPGIANRFRTEHEARRMARRYGLDDNGEPLAANN